MKFCTRAHMLFSPPVVRPDYTAERGYQWLRPAHHLASFILAPILVCLAASQGERKLTAKGRPYQASCNRFTLAIGWTECNRQKLNLHKVLMCVFSRNAKPSVAQRFHLWQRHFVKLTTLHMAGGRNEKITKEFKGTREKTLDARRFTWKYNLFSFCLLYHQC